MGDDERRILFGFHGETFGRSMVTLAECIGARVTVCPDADDLISRLREGGYHAVAIDANWGYPNSRNLTEAIRVRDAIASYTAETGQTVDFLVYAAMDDVVQYAREHGLPAESKMDSAEKTFAFFEGQRNSPV